MLQVTKSGSESPRFKGVGFHQSTNMNLWPYALPKPLNTATNISISTLYKERHKDTKEHKPDNYFESSKDVEECPDRPSNPTQDHQSQGKKGFCAVCGISCRTLCGGCKGTFYCSKKHQQVNWAKHKTECRPFSIPSQYPNGWCPTTRSSPSPRANNSTKSTTSNKNKTDQDGGSQELKWMVANREIQGGITLFSEKPLIFAPDYPNDFGSYVKNRRCVCQGCYSQFPVYPGGSSGDNNVIDLDVCKRCLLPLCHDCVVDSKSNVSEDHSKHFYWSHSQSECQAVSDAVAKNRQMMTQRNENLGQSSDLVKDCTILRILLLYKENPNKWESFYSLKGNPRYAISTKFPSDFVKEWISSEYPISENYLKHSFRDKSVKLEEVIRIFSVFSDISFFHPHLRVLYELRSWIPHACTPNAEFHFKPGDQSQTLYVKTVDTARPDGLITVNYLSNYEDGVSKAAIRLYTMSGLSCADSRCQCRISGMDSSVGVKCNLLSGAKDTLVSCPGYLSPVLDAPNPEKPNLGMLIYIKSKSWNCNKCRKSEKFTSIQKQVKEITEKMKKEVEDYCTTPDSVKYTNVKQALKKTLSDNHWLLGKFNEMTLTCWNKIVGEGNDMLATAVGFTPGDDHKNFMGLLSQKIQLYGNGIFSQPQLRPYQSTEMLTIIARQRGRLSPIRGIYLFDAFYSNLIVFTENFKQKLSEVLTSNTKMAELITDTMRCWQILIRLLEEASLSLSLFETEEGNSKVLMASQMLQVFQDVYSKAVNNRAAVLQYMVEFLEVYAIQDVAFIARTLSKFKPMTDDIDNFFDLDPRSYVNLTFGPATFGAAATSQFNTTSFRDMKKEQKGSGATGKGAKGTGGKTTTKGTRKPESARKPEFPSFKLPNHYSLISSSDSEDGLGGNTFGSFLNDELNDDDDDLFGLPMEYYEKLLSESVRQRMVTEEILRNLFK